MKYMFPHITHISDVLPAIEGSKDFVVAEKDDYTVISYVVITPETFPPVKGVIYLEPCGIPDETYDMKAALRRECRGLTFCSKTGKILARKFHKFFNVNEKDETQACDIDLSQPHEILEKLDGSMIAPIQLDLDGDKIIRWTTKMGITDVAENAEVFVAQNPAYVEVAQFFIERGFTPIFEWCSRKNKIVVDYPEDQLVLLAVRNMTTGEYMKESLFVAKEMFDIPVVKSYPSTGDVDDLIETVRQQDGSEGVIIRFDDGHMVKIKSEWYVQLHKAKELISNERNLVAMILDANTDDLKAFLTKEQLDGVSKFEGDVWNAVGNVSTALFNASMHYQNICHGDRKTFAMEHANDLDTHTRQMIFRMWDGDAHHKANISTQLVVDTLRNHLTSNKKYNIIKQAFNIPDVEYEIN